MPPDANHSAYNPRPVSARFSDGLQIHFKPPTPQSPPQSQKEIGSSGYLAGALSARFESHEGRGKNLGGILDNNRGRLDRNQIGCGDYCAHCDWRFKWIKIAMFARQNEAGRLTICAPPFSRLVSPSSDVRRPEKSGRAAGVSGGTRRS